jgi:hypothetical protein
MQQNGRFASACPRQVSGKCILSLFSDGYLPAHEIHAAIRGRWPIPYDFAADPEARAAVSASLAGFQPFEDRLNAVGSVRDAALKRLLRTPAPDLPALALKIELAVDEEVATLAGGERCLAVLKADGWRLAERRPR